MKKIALSVLIASVFFGCGGDKKVNNTAAPITNTLAPGVTPPVQPAPIIENNKPIQQEAPPPIQQVNFNFLSAYKNYLKNGGSSKYNITGSCNGTAYEYAYKAEEIKKQNGVIDNSVRSEFFIFFENCENSNRYPHAITDYNANFDITSIVYCSTRYSCFSSQSSTFSKKSDLPLSVKGEESGIYGVLFNYNDLPDFSKTLIGTSEISYAVSKYGNSANSFIVSFTKKEYDTNQLLQRTTIDKFRLFDNEVLEKIGFDILWPNNTKITAVKQ
jgi:hypothetical protein